MRLTGLLLMLMFVISSPMYAKGKESSEENANRGELRDDDYPGKGKGRPDNPGEHGRENAAEKQSRGHGNGSKKEDTGDDNPPDHLDGDAKSQGKKQNKE